MAWGFRDNDSMIINGLGDNEIARDILNSHDYVRGGWVRRLDSNTLYPANFGREKASMFSSGRRKATSKGGYNLYGDILQ